MAVKTVVVKVGGQIAEVEYAGLAPKLVGVWQINAKVPMDLGIATTDVVLEAGELKVGVVPGVTGPPGLPGLTGATGAAGPTIGYTIVASATRGDPADGATYFFGCMYGRSFTDDAGTGGLRRCYIPKAGTIKAAYVMFWNSNLPPTLGTGETSTINIRLNNTTDAAISSSFTTDAVTTTFNNTALSIAVVVGDFFEIKWVTPTWATNPTRLLPSVMVYIE